MAGYCNFTHVDLIRLKPAVQLQQSNSLLGGSSSQCHISLCEWCIVPLHIPNTLLTIDIDIAQCDSTDWSCIRRFSCDDVHTIAQS